MPLTLEKIKSANVAVLGLGIEGVALCNFLAGKVKTLTVCDRASKVDILKNSEGEFGREVAKIIADKSIVKILGNDYLDNLNTFDIIFRSPSIYFNDEKLLSAKALGKIVSTQIGLFLDLCSSRVIGVTGTKGKGTTSSLIYQIIKSYFAQKCSERNVFIAGNIGYPALDLLSKLNKRDIVVLELSNFQLADIDKSPNIAVFTNLGVDHLDYHKDIAEYHEAKFNIFKFQSHSDFAIINKNSKFGAEKLDLIKSRKLFFSEYNDGSEAVIKDLGPNHLVILDPSRRSVEICKSDELNLVGKHNLENIAAAAIVADLLNIPAQIITNAVKEFKPLPFRTEFVDEIDGVKYVNDSFATNPGPTISAIKSFKENKVLILGGSDKGADYLELVKVIVSSNVNAVVLIGAEASKIKLALIDASYSKTIADGFISFDAAVKRASSLAKPGDVVIMSPACASFDMFKNYKDRGEKFKQAVLNLRKK